MIPKHIRQKRSTRTLADAVACTDKKHAQKRRNESAGHNQDQTAAGKTEAKADELYYAQVDVMTGLRALFNNAPDLTSAITKAIRENAQLKKDVEAFMVEKLELYRDKLIARAEDYHDIKLVRITGDVEPGMIRGVLPLLKGRFTDLEFRLSSQFL